MPAKTLTLGYSPCPNDTFIFYALAHGKINAGDLRFREILEDVETLNRMARRAELDITKISFHAYGHLRETYCLLRSGAAIGKGCGPLVVSKKYQQMNDLRGKKIAIPGQLTTAFLLLQLFDPLFKGNVIVMPFHRIINAVRNDEADAGLIIHESRFTYQDAGLNQVVDLGEWWERETGLPIPLGGIIAKRELGEAMIKEIDRGVRKSLEYAFEHKAEPKSYIKKHSQEIEDSVIEQHIGLYVLKRKG
ncbi:MAG: 1,4-dihydroxy-6-naphthoate synthase [Nitrospira bacterium HGW-Nitrospira-1]|nr:MAG: 1,4-dihydroxy-6-naphthoate synthase [Nitrospira bacterium HGW-Nitrospira-1]